MYAEYGNGADDAAGDNDTGDNGKHGAGLGDAEYPRAERSCPCAGYGQRDGYKEGDARRAPLFDTGTQLDAGALYEAVEKGTVKSEAQEHFVERGKKKPAERGGGGVEGGAGRPRYVPRDTSPDSKGYRAS